MIEESHEPDSILEEHISNQLKHFVGHILTPTSFPKVAHFG